MQTKSFSNRRTHNPTHHSLVKMFRPQRTEVWCILARAITVVATNSSPQTTQCFDSDKFSCERLPNARTYGIHLECLIFLFLTCYQHHPWRELFFEYVIIPFCHLKWWERVFEYKMHGHVQVPSWCSNKHVNRITIDTMIRCKLLHSYSAQWHIHNGIYTQRSYYIHLDEWIYKGCDPWPQGLYIRMLLFTTSLHGISHITHSFFLVFV